MSDDDEAAGTRFDVTRTLALTDGVFAISLTLLVLGIVVPDGLTNADQVNGALSDLTADFLALALSFLVVGRFWIGHHQTFRVIDSVDVALMWLNIVFLAWIALMPFSTSLLASYGEFAVPTVVYAVTIALAALTSSAIHWWAIERLHHGHVASPLESGTLVVALVFLVSVPIAFVAGPDVAKVSWLATPVVGALRRRLVAPSRGTAGR